MRRHYPLAGLKKAFFTYDETSKKARPETQVMIEHANALQTTLRGLDQGEDVRSAAIHYLVTGNKIIAILTTPHNQTSFESQVESKELNNLIQDYRLALLEENPDQRGAPFSIKRICWCWQPARPGSGVETDRKSTGSVN